MSRSTPATATTPPGKTRCKSRVWIAGIVVIVWSGPGRSVTPGTTTGTPRLGRRDGRRGLDVAAPGGALERLRRVEQQLVAAPRRVELEPDRHPALAEADGHADRRHPGEVGEAAEAGVGVVRGVDAGGKLDRRVVERRRDGGHGRPRDHVDALECAGARAAHEAAPPGRP